MEKPFAYDDHLRRLPPEYYQGLGYVHWSLTINGRRQGWLKPILYYKFRELLTHTACRYELCCPIFCCMPDHLHLHWIGFNDNSDQRVAMKYFRRHFNNALKAIGYELQSQGHDHVLKEEDRERDAFEKIVEYIARNPERAGLVREGEFKSYPYTSCIVPGYPELRPFLDDYWSRFWRVYSHLRRNGISRKAGAED